MKAARTTQPPRIAVLVDTAAGWGRRLVHGILMYSRLHGPWHLWLEPRGPHEHLRPPPGWEGEGIIARVSTPAMAHRLAALKIPVVNVSGIQYRGPSFPRVTTVSPGSARFAAQHFLDRGFRHFAYYGILRFPYVAEHYRAFADFVTEAGGDCAAYRPPRGLGDWKKKQAHLGRWLRELPKPVGVFAWGLQGLAVLDACRWAGLLVPEQVAVLSGDDDDLLCEATTPPLSGIQTPTELIGREAAAVLDQLMKGQPASDRPIVLSPTRVVTRQSTDTLAIDDADLASAMRFIHENAAKAITVDDLLREVPLSRRSLERRFLQVFGRSPADEIRRVRLQRAQQVLLETDRPISDVAAVSGFGSPEYLSCAFKAAFGMTPLKYRSHVRAASLHPASATAPRLAAKRGRL